MAEGFAQCRRQRRLSILPGLLSAGLWWLALSPSAAAATLSSEVAGLAAADGFTVVGLDNTAGMPAVPAEGDLRSRLEALLRDFNHVTVDAADGGVARVIIGSHRHAAAAPAATAATPRAVTAALAVGVMASPLEQGRLTSAFGPRRHPLLGGLDFHQGIDLAAPTGTPVHAPADGTVVEMGWRGAYGLYVRIRHDATYETAYGHLSGLAPGLSVGRRVARGTAIGYVGASGRVTGPHLHYEVLANGVPVDPQGMTASSPPPEIHPAAIEADLRRALLLAVVGHRIDAVLGRGASCLAIADGQGAPNC